MACAGYLVRNNTTVVYVKIVNGLLVCTAAALHRAALDDEDDDAHPSLPLLAPKPMARAPSFLMQKTKRHASTQQPEDEPMCGKREPKYEAPRVVQLSGHVVEVVDCAKEANDSVFELLPFSFRVKTKKMTLHADASFSFTPADTLLLAAVDQSTKDEWMKRLARWSRYGWQAPKLLAADDEDAASLERALQRWRDSEASSVIKPAVMVYGYAGIATRSTTRRRFYRNTGSFYSTYAAVNTTCSIEDSA